MPKKPRISMVVAMGKNRVIGKGNELLWHIPDDLRRFKALTLGHPVIMGRKTFDSIFAMLGKPLPGRTNTVVTRSSTPLGVNDPRFDYENVVVTHGVEEALEKARALDTEEIFVIGGAQIYEQALPFTDRLYLTLIEDEKEGDAYFSAYEHLFTKIISEETYEHEGLKYRWVDIEK